MQKKTYITLFIMMVLMNYQSFAQNTKERIQNNNQIAEGKKNLERDTKELAEAKVKVSLFNKEFDAKNLAEVKILKLKIIKDFRREVRQSEEKAVKARREISQSSAEVRSDRRELQRDRNDSNQRSRYDKKDDKKDMRRDQANKRDDKRDRRDDIRDFEAQVERAEQQKTILDGLIKFTFGFEGILLEKSIAQKVLMEKFINTMEADIAAIKREIAEDKRERNEDRRERRDDRKERNETDKKVKKKKRRN